MKNTKKIIKIFNVIFIISMLINVFCTASFATENIIPVTENVVSVTENVVQTSEKITTPPGVVVTSCNSREHTIILIIQLILQGIAFVLWGISTYKLIRKDRKENKKKIIILTIIGLIFFYVAGFLGYFRCA